MILSPKHTLRISKGTPSLISPHLLFFSILTSMLLHLFSIDSVLWLSTNIHYYWKLQSTFWCINRIWTEFCEIVSFFLLTRYMDWLSSHCIVFQMDFYCWYRHMPASSILPFLFKDFYLPSNWPVSPITSLPHTLGCEIPRFHGVTLNRAFFCGVLSSGYNLEILPVSLQVVPLSPIFYELSVLSAINAYYLQSDGINSDATCWPKRLRM